MQTMEIKTIEDLGRFAEKIISILKEKKTAQTIGLVGDLGAGKTALTKEFAKVLGVIEEITSPTFVVMKSYTIPNHQYFKTLSHIDAYRIEDEDEMRVLRLSELLEDPTQLVIIEWPEKIKNLLPKDVLYITLKITQGETREVSYGNYK